MHKRFTFLFFLVSLFFSTTLFAQRDSQGTIVDSFTNESVAGARISLLNKKDSVIQSTATSASGQFMLKATPIGSYTLEVYAMGYKKVRVPLDIESLATPKPILIRLSLNSNVLADVNIEAPVPMVAIKGDTTEFNASSFTNEPYADSDALIAQLPGIVIDEDGKLMANGEEVQRIMVDGKEFLVPTLELQ